MPKPTSDDRSPITGYPDAHRDMRPREWPREPYEKPTVTEINVKKLLETCFVTEGQMYRRLNALADKTRDTLDQLVAMEVELRGLSEELDRADADLKKVQFCLEVAGGPVQGQG